MLKIRLMGTKDDIKWFEDILRKSSKLKVTNFSNLYANKGTKKYFRTYVEIQKRD